MIDMEKIKRLWPEWIIGRMIGKGSFGAVYEIHRDIFSSCETAALKVLAIPQKQSDVDKLRSEGYNEENIRERFDKHLKDIAEEYKMMADLKDHTNIVYCDDLRYMQNENGIGGKLTIKMELLTSLSDYLNGQLLLDDKTVIRIGMDICKALSICRANKIIHRDVKPQNIFVSKDGNYKLGDFGIARAIEGTSNGTCTGTYKYMAPEVYNHESYGDTVDIYSLGMVLYWLLNERRGPFLPLPPENMTFSQEEKANIQRFSGKKLPPPAHGNAELRAVVLKACEYAPQNRYANPEEMLRALERTKFAAKNEETDLAVGLWDVQKKQGPKKTWIAMAAATAAVALTVGAFSLFNFKAPADALRQEPELQPMEQESSLQIDPVESPAVQESLPAAVKPEEPVKSEEPEESETPDNTVEGPAAIVDSLVDRINSALVSWETVYQEILESRTAELSYVDPDWDIYCLYDITGDHEPELFLQKDGMYYIYQYIDGETKQIGEVPGRSFKLCPMNNSTSVLSVMQHMFCETVTAYCYSDGTLTETILLKEIPVEKLPYIDSLPTDMLGYHVFDALPTYGITDFSGLKWTENPDTDNLYHYLALRDAITIEFVEGYDTYQRYELGLVCPIPNDFIADTASDNPWILQRFVNQNTGEEIEIYYQKNDTAMNGEDGLQSFISEHAGMTVDYSNYGNSWYAVSLSSSNGWLYRKALIKENGYAVAWFDYYVPSDSTGDSHEAHIEYMEDMFSVEE